MSSGPLLDHSSNRYEQQVANATSSVGYYFEVKKPSADHPRINLLVQAVQRVSDGNKTAFGKMLGYKDGAFVRQMASGARPITEKTILQIEALPGMSGWFTGALPPSPNGAAAPVSMAAARGRPSLRTSLEVLGEYIEAADGDARADALAMLQLFLKNPTANRGQVPLIVERLSGELPSAQDADHRGNRAA